MVRPVDIFSLLAVVGLTAAPALADADASRSVAVQASAPGREAPDLTRAERLRAEAKAAFADADTARSAGAQTWVASSLWGTEWRPSPTGETDLWVRSAATEQPDDDYAEPTPESLAAEEAQALRNQEMQAEVDGHLERGCLGLEKAADAVRQDWPAGRPGMAGPLAWLARDADYRCGAHRLAFLGEVAAITEVEQGTESDQYRASLYDHALAFMGTVEDDETLKAQVFARLDAVDRDRLGRLRDRVGSDHPDVADALLSFAPFGEGNDARIGRHEEVVAIRTRAYGLHDYRTHDAMEALAGVLGEVERYDDAQALRDLADPELETGRDPLDATIEQASIGNLFGLYYGSGDLVTAQAMAREGLSRALDDYDQSSPEVGIAANRLGIALLARGDFATAEPFLKLATENISAGVRPIVPLTLLSDPAEGDRIDKAVVDSDKAAAILGNLAYVLAAQGKVTDAEVIYRQALALREAADAATNGTRRARILGGLGELVASQGRIAEGRALLEQAVELSYAPQNDEGGPGVFARRALASIYEREGRPDLAEPLVRDALSFMDVGNGPQPARAETAADLHQNGPPLMTALGRILASTGRRDAAAPLFPRANRGHLRRWCPESDARFAQHGRYDWTYDDPRCQAHPDFTLAVVDQARFLEVDRAAAATRTWRHAGDMALGRSRLRFSGNSDARLDFDAGRAVHRAFVSSAWTASEP